MILNLTDPEVLRRLQEVRWLNESDDHLISYLLDAVEKKKATSN
jgi:hypothetical protein